MRRTLGILALAALPLLGACTPVVGGIGTAIQAGPGGVTEVGTGQPVEDSPEFDCRLHGNHICGSDRYVVVWLTDGTTFRTDPHTAADLVARGQVSSYQPVR